MIEAGNESPFPSSAGTSGSASAGAASSLGAMGSKMHEATSDAAASATRSARAAEDAMEGGVHRMAQKAHEAVDRLEQSLGAGSERMMDWQQEWRETARDQVRASPLTSVGIAFAAGLVFGRVSAAQPLRLRAPSCDYPKSPLHPPRNRPRAPAPG